MLNLLLLQVIHKNMKLKLLGSEFDRCINFSFCILFETLGREA